jgi:hypothetical protein
MQRELDGFEAWYKHTFSGRMLSWRHQHTSVTMTARFPGGNKEIGVSLFQATVLLQFNDVDTLNFEELLARTGIGEGNREILYLERPRLLTDRRSYRARGAGTNAAISIRFEGNSSACQAATRKGCQSDRYLYLELWIHSGQGSVQDQSASAGSLGERWRWIDVRIARSNFAIRPIA